MGARGPAAPRLQSTFADAWKIPLRRESDADIVVNPSLRRFIPEMFADFLRSARQKARFVIPSGRFVKLKMQFDVISS